MVGIFRFSGKRKLHDGETVEPAASGPLEHQATLPMATEITNQAKGTSIDDSALASSPEVVVEPIAELRSKSERPRKRASLNKVPAVAPLAKQPRRIAIDPGDDTQFAHTVMQDYGSRLVGEILQQYGHLTAEQVAQVLDHQNNHGTRFGESAVALGLVKSQDVMFALSKQFGYDYTPVTTETDGKNLSDELVVARYPFSQAAETVRDLRSELLSGVLNPDVEPHCALAVVSLDQGDGKSWLAANLAVSLSQLGSRTLLVDANLRAPRLHQIFGIESPKGGLSGILQRRLRAEALRPTRALPNLFLLPAGATPPNPLEMLQGRSFLELMHKLRNNFTHVIVDTPAAAYSADARLVAARCGASVMVARKHKNSLPALNDLARLLSKGNAQFAGMVVNEV